MTDPRPSASERAAAIARARAQVAVGPGPDLAHVSPKPPKHPAAASRVMAAGVAASAGLMLVAGMAAAAEREQRSTPTPGSDPARVVHRVVTIEVPASPGAAEPAPTPEPTVVREVRVLPAPAATAQAAPVASEGS